MYERVPHRVTAELLASAWEWSTAHGERMLAKPCDYRLTDPDTADQWSISSAAFAAGYAQVDGGIFESRGRVTAHQVGADEDPVTVQSLEGTERAHPGDWIVQDLDGNEWVTSAAEFARRYRAIAT